MSVKSVILSEVDSEALSKWLIARSECKSEKFPGHSIHFETFPPKLITVPDNYASDYMGNIWPARFGFAPSSGTFETSIPNLSEEYFEFLDIFEAAMDADEHFTFHEWGAGFGRWTSLGVGAARTMGIKNIDVGCVEAYPEHISYIRQNYELMMLPSQNAVVYPFALSHKKGNELFVIGQPPKEEPSGPNADPWYGQALNDMNEFVPNGKYFHSHAELQNPNGWRAIEVPVEPASLVLKDYDFIDIVDMDLQGAEADVVDESIGLLNQRVRRLHIGTHGSGIEARLRETLNANGWIQIRDLACHNESVTSYGTVHCVDGVQSWFNPRFPPRQWL